MNKSYITENRLRYWKSLKGKKHTAEHNEKIGLGQIGLKKGKSYEEMYGPKKSKAIKEKMRQRKLGKHFHWSRPHPKGKDHPRYIKDRSILKRHERRNDPAYLCWARDVKNRDNWRCKIGNNDCNKKVVAHHILPWKSYPELRYKLNNGITLCRFHHPRKREDEIKLIQTFTGLVTQS